MTNILAAVGRGQLRVLNDRFEAKRRIFNYYHEALGGIPGIQFIPEASYGRSNRWLTVILITPEVFGADREIVRLTLEKENIESRPIWKPMHMQPVFDLTTDPHRRTQTFYSTDHRGGKECQRFTRFSKGRVPARVVGGAVAEDLFNRGLCLPSGTAMNKGDLDRVIDTILNCRSG